ncbi:DUF2330 domain-containing protein [Actinophytocola algeriensis]|uniref:DUF2330 domain-containing protein n=1 Tax=Actinophytocola algeriensis TaxID=1768010 RepID=A0A7W7VCM0_9PSEU|nr:DUF2330 domain-containing protein [Actinophytocola algeriensis]MBB4905159.1 hypothetical protein [Actinophytocola algeriensis]MBE1473156.1 hypothetical protein [Actinophytocola algeriensis]
MSIGGGAARAAVVAVLAATLVTVSPAESGACACGAFVANDKLSAQQETALVDLTGRTESITLSVLARSAADEAAFLMPVPSRARFEVADADLFAELDEISKPDIEVREVEVDGDGSGGAAPGGSGATVVDHVEVGPFDVAQLAGTDATAVTDWLGDNGFTMPQDLSGALTPYLAEGWLVVAVRLAPASGNLEEGLPPMRVSFETDTPVYPMRLSATAEDVQPLRLYVLADHRVDISNPAPAGAAPELTFAGRVEPGPEHPTLSEMLPGPRFLTRYDGEFAPDLIESDVRITTATTDEPYRAVVVVTEYVRSSWREVVLAIIVLLAVVGVAIVALRRRRSRVDGRA